MTAPSEVDLELFDHSLCGVEAQLYGTGAFCLATRKPGLCVGAHHPGTILAPPTPIRVPGAPVAPTADQKAATAHTDASYRQAYLAAHQVAVGAGLTGQRHGEVAGAMHDYARALQGHQRAEAHAATAYQRAQVAHDTAEARSVAQQTAFRAREAAAEARGRAAVARAKLHHAARGRAKVVAPAGFAVSEFGDGVYTTDTKPGKCKFCGEPATHRVVHGEGRQVVQVDEKHVTQAKRAIHDDGSMPERVDQWTGSSWKRGPDMMSYGTDLYGQPAEFELYGLLSWAHAGCSVGEFCRNPLHPGPCKGWKHMLHSVAPGAYHAYEQQRVGKLNEKRVAKIKALQALGHPVPKHLLKEHTYDQVPKAPVGTPFAPPTPKEAVAKLPATANEIGEKIGMKHAAAAEAKLADQHQALVSVAQALAPGMAKSAASPVVKKKLADAAASLKPGEKLSEHPIVAETIKQLAEKASQKAGGLNEKQKADIAQNIADHVDHGITEPPLLVTSAINHGKAKEAESALATEKSAHQSHAKTFLEAYDKVNWSQATPEARQKATAKIAEIIASEHTTPEQKKMAMAIKSSIVFHSAHTNHPAHVEEALKVAHGKSGADPGARLAKLSKLTPQDYAGLSDTDKQAVVTHLAQLHQQSPVWSKSAEHAAAGMGALDHLKAYLGKSPEPAAEPKPALNVTVKNDVAGQVADVLKQLDTSSPTSAPQGKLKPVSGGALGTHGAKKMTDEAGKEFVVKPAAPGSEMTSHAEQGAADLAKAAGLPAPEHVAVSAKGESVQSVVPGEEAFPGKKFDPSKLTQGQVLDLQKHHVLDWLIGNHDAHPGQFIKQPDGHLAEIDKAQSFKHYGSDKLSSTYHPNGAYGETEPVYNTLLKAAKDGKVTLHSPASGPLHDFITHVQGLPDDQVKAMFRPYAEAAHKAGKLPGGGTVDDFLGKIVARKGSLGSDFAKLFDQEKIPTSAEKAASGAKKAATKVTEPGGSLAEHAKTIMATTNMSVTQKGGMLSKEHFDALPPATQSQLLKQLKDVEADAGPTNSAKATALIEKFTGKAPEHKPAGNATIAKLDSETHVENQLHILGFELSKSHYDQLGSGDKTKVHQVVADGLASSDPATVADAKAMVSYYGIGAGKAGTVAPSSPTGPAHVETAQSLATGATYGTAKAKVSAYGKLSQKEYHSLPLDVQQKIHDHLQEAHGKFLDPKKKAEVVKIQDKLGMPTATPAGAGAPHGLGGTVPPEQKAAAQAAVSVSPSKPPKGAGAGGSAEGHAHVPLSGTAAQQASKHHAAYKAAAVISGGSGSSSQSSEAKFHDAVESGKVGDQVNGSAKAVASSFMANKAPAGLTEAQKTVLHDKVHGEVSQMITTGDTSPPTGGVLAAIQAGKDPAAVLKAAGIKMPKAGVAGTPMHGVTHTKTTKLVPAAHGIMQVQPTGQTVKIKKFNDRVTAAAHGDAGHSSVPYSISKLASVHKKSAGSEKLSGVTAGKIANAFHSYSGHQYADINGYLRRKAKGEVVGESYVKANEPLVKAMDAGFEHAHATHDIVVYRGIGDAADTFGADWHPDSSMVGLEFTEPGYSSTSTVPHIGFGGGSLGARYRILVPKGYPAMSMHGGQHSGEDELLLPRGTKFRIVADNGYQNGTRQFDVEVILP